MNTDTFISGLVLIVLVSIFLVRKQREYADKYKKGKQIAFLNFLVDTTQSNIFYIQDVTNFARIMDKSEDFVNECLNREDVEKLGDSAYRWIQKSYSWDSIK